MIEGIVLAAAGLIILASGLASASGRLRRNGVVGIRTRTSMSSDEAWDIVHRAGGPWLVASGLAMLIGGGVAAVAGSDAVRMAATLTAIVLCLVLALASVLVGHAAYRGRVR
ncbi:SdpI family protein [Spirillospora sp. NPDC049652]